MKERAYNRWSVFILCWTSWETAIVGQRWAVILRWTTNGKHARCLIAQRSVMKCISTCIFHLQNTFHSTPEPSWRRVLELTYADLSDHCSFNDALLGLSTLAIQRMLRIPIWYAYSFCIIIVQQKLGNGCLNSKSNFVFTKPPESQYLNRGNVWILLNQSST